MLLNLYLYIYGYYLVCLCMIGILFYNKTILNYINKTIY